MCTVCRMTQEQDARSALPALRFTLHNTPSGTAAVGISTASSFRSQDRAVLSIPPLGCPEANPPTVTVGIEQDTIFQRSIQRGGIIDYPHPPAVVPNPDIQYLVDRDLVATLPSKIYMLLQCLESCKDIAGNFRQESGKPDGSLSIGQVPEIDLPLADMGQGPGPPYTVMMIMIGRLHARQHLSLWRPYRVYEYRTFE